VDIRLAPLGLAARADRRHDLAFLDRRACDHADRADVHERDRVAVRSANGEAKTFVRQPPGEGNDTGYGSTELGAGRAPDVDAAMLAARVRVALSHERPQDRSLDGPCPPGRRGTEDERDEHRGSDGRDSVAQFDNHAGTLSGGSAVVKYGYSDPR
jgi:hypothetical protein